MTSTANKFEDILKCPITDKELSWLSHDQLLDLNSRIQNNSIKLRNGERHNVLVHGAFKVKDTELYYPVWDDIFYLLAECVLVGDYQEGLGVQNNAMKAQVKQFYDNFGWHENTGVYQDAKDSEDLRAVSQEYIERCHLRLNQFLPAKGTYLLDVASGPVQYPAYLTYSKNFDYRICADISILALKEAKKKLGAKGIYLLCDVTNLPLKANVIDAGISLHTLYHVPANEQAKAFDEIYRVVKPGGASVIVYSWGSKSLLMNLLMLPQKAWSLLKRKLIPSKAQKALYFHAHSFAWFSNEIQPKYKTELYAWRSVNVPFLKSFIHQYLGGRSILKLFYWLEEKAPQLMGRIGAYPLFVSKK